MSPRNPELSDAWQLRQKSLSRWENEGGAVPSSHQGGIVQSDAVPQTNSELDQLRVGTASSSRVRAGELSHIVAGAKL